MSITFLSSRAWCMPLVLMLVVRRKKRLRGCFMGRVEVAALRDFLKSGYVESGGWSWIFRFSDFVRFRDEATVSTTGTVPTSFELRSLGQLTAW